MNRVFLVAMGVEKNQNFQTSTHQDRRDFSSIAPFLPQTHLL